MAKVGNNIVTTGLSGKLGNLIVFRNRGGKTYVAQAPKKKTTEWSEAQERHRLHFQEAVLYAKNAIANEATKEAYEASAKECETAYNVEVADFINAPHTDEIDMNHYTGQPGSYIQIRTVADFEVKEVTVTNQNTDGTQVESGSVTLREGSMWWRYTATVVNDLLEGDKT
jgi:Na+-transporting NADH:ubiquinone oxidoreductase subunit NqrF